MILTFEAPSGFSAGGNEYPAGRYQIEAKSDNASILLLRSLEDKKVQANISVVTRVSAKPDAAGIVVFDQVDSKLTISEVYPHSGDGYILASTKESHTHKKANSAGK